MQQPGNGSVFFTCTGWKEEEEEKNLPASSIHKRGRRRKKKPKKRRREDHTGPTLSGRMRRGAN